MKKTFFFVLTICATVFTGCTNSEDQKVESSDFVVPSARFSGTSFDNYYLLHNPSLDVFFTDVQNNPALYFANTPSGRDRGYTVLTDYLRSESSPEISTTWLNQYFAAQKNADYTNNVDFQRITHNAYYIQLNYIIDHNTNISTVKSQIASLIANLENDNSVSAFDKVALKASMQVGGQSFDYWTTNYTKWKNLAAANNVNRSPTKTAMMHADVEGAISGAIGGAMMGAPFAGAPAFAGALLGAMYGAAWGSAVSGAFMHFNIWG